MAEGPSATISQRYFDGHEPLFAVPAGELAKLTRDTETVVAELKQEWERTGQQAKIDLAALRDRSGQAAAPTIELLVDIG